MAKVWQPFGLGSSPDLAEKGYWTDDGAGATAPAPSNLTGTTPYEGSPWDLGAQPFPTDFTAPGGGTDAWDWFDPGTPGPWGSISQAGNPPGQLSNFPYTPGFETPLGKGGGGGGTPAGGGGKPGGGGGRPGAIPGGVSPAQQQQQAGLKQEKFQQGLQNFMTMMKALGINLGGGGTAFQPVTPPNYMDLIRAAIDAAAKKQNLALSEEAAATGGAGGSVLAGFPGKGAEAQQGAYGQAAAGGGAVWRSRCRPPIRARPPGRPSGPSGRRCVGGRGLLRPRGRPHRRPFRQAPKPPPPAPPGPRPP